MITTPRMVFWCFSIVLPVHVTYLYRRQSVCLLCFECIDGLPLDLVMHSYGNPLTRHETEATPSGKVLCRRAKSLGRTHQSPYCRCLERTRLRLAVAAQKIEATVLV